MNMQADLNLLCAQMSEGTFSHIVALIILGKKFSRSVIHFNLFITRFVNMVLDITWFKDGSQKCIDYIEK